MPCSGRGYLTKAGLCPKNERAWMLGGQPSTVSAVPHPLRLTRPYQAGSLFIFLSWPLKKVVGIFGDDQEWALIIICSSP